MQASKKAWAALRDVHPLCNDGSRAVWKISVPPSDGAGVLMKIKSSADARGYYDWAGGLVWLDVPNTDNACESTVRSAIRNGHATLIRAPEDIRAHTDVFAPQEKPLAALTERVKAAFDPKGILLPYECDEETWLDHLEDLKKGKVPAKTY